MRLIERWYRGVRQPDIAETRAALVRAVDRRYGGGAWEEMRSRGAASRSV